MKYELCEYKPVRVIGYGWVAIAEFETEEEAIKEKGLKDNPANFLVRIKKEERKSSVGIIMKNLPKGHNLSASERKRIWRNPESREEFRKLM